MITGQKPFVEDDARTVMQKIRLDRFVSPRKLNHKVPRQLERILARCMEKMPANRYPTTQALIDDLMEFLAPRVPINYSARMVMYLRDVGLLTDEEADTILEAGAPRNVRRGPLDRSLLRHVAGMQGLLFAVALVGGLGIQRVHGRLSEGADEFAAEDRPVLPDRAGFLRVVAHPWAHVSVDGQRVLTTPSARRIPLRPGRHFLKFENPYYQPVDREVRIREGETEVLDVTMSRRGSQPTTADASAATNAGGQP
jgi:serine/threonine-protein kinase